MDEQTKVLVLPFSPALATDPDWISRAVQQSIVADLSRPTTGRPIQPMSDATSINSTLDAMEAGKKAGAKYVVFGNYQTIEPSLKVTGQVVDVETNKVIGGLKSTGSVRDLFDMQDRLAAQVRFAIATERLAGKQVKPTDVQPRTPEPPPTIEPQGPVVMGDKHPYDESDLSRAVADDVSLIDRYDAAGQSYRQQYYDDRYYNSYLPFYSTYPYYGYYGYGYGGYFGPYVPISCRPHHHHHDDRTDATPPVAAPTPAPTPTPNPAPPDVGFNPPANLNGPIPMSAGVGSNGNYNRPLYGNTNTAMFNNFNDMQFGNSNVSQYPNFNKPLYRNYNTGPNRNSNNTGGNSVSGNGGGISVKGPGNSNSAPRNTMGAGQ